MSTHDPAGYTPNQLVAYNLARARRHRGWTQEETVERLAPYLGTKWSTASLSAAERSVTGGRIKQFDADEIVALARAFDVPILWFLMPPPRDEAQGLCTPDAPRAGYSYELLLDVLFGDVSNRPVLEKALLSWASTYPTADERKTISDVVEDDLDLRLRIRLREVFGDIGEAKETLRHVAGAIEQLETSERNMRLLRSDPAEGNRPLPRPNATTQNNTDRDT